MIGMTKAQRRLMQDTIKDIAHRSGVTYEQARDIVVSVVGALGEENPDEQARLDCVHPRTRASRYVHCGVMACPNYRERLDV